MSNNLQPLEINTNGTNGAFSANELTTNSFPNYAKNPNLFHSNHILSAQGKFLPYNKMKGGSKLSTLVENKMSDVSTPGPKSGHAHVGTYDNKPVARSTHIGGRRKKSIKRKSMKNKTIKRHTMKRHTMKRKSMKNKKHNRKIKHNRNSRRIRRHRGGNSQPFNNQPISFGYGFDGTKLSPSDSALASPMPIKSYSNCGIVKRN